MAETERVAFLFAGQGSQEVGMGKDLAAAEPAARAVFEAADQALGFALSRTMWEGPADALVQTEVQQPALLTLAVAHAQCLRAKGLAPVALCGHSLGEYPALVAAGALAFADALPLVRERGRLMQATVPEGEGGMAALVHKDRDAIYAWCDAERDAGGSVDVACHNAPGQSVVSGAKASVERVSAVAAAAGARVVALPVSAPFHCQLLEPMLDAFAAVVAATPLAPPSIPVLDNVTAHPLGGPDAIRDALVKQITAAVRFEESLAYLRDELNITRYVQCGPGNALLGFAKRTARGATLETFEQAMTA